MIKQLCVAGILGLPLSSVALSQSVEEDTVALRTLINGMGNNYDYFRDGSTRERKRKCNEITSSGIRTQSGLYSDWKSRRNGNVTVVPVDPYDWRNSDYWVTLKVKCTQKQQKKAGCGGYVEDTSWKDHYGNVKLKVAIGRRGYLTVADWTRNATSICGTGIANEYQAKIDRASID